MTDSAVLPNPAPGIDPETKPFWDATLEGKLLIKHCTACGENHWYPRTICPFCGSFETEWLETSGKGTIYTFSITRKGMGHYGGTSPYVLAFVTLAEGPTMMTNIVECDVDALQCGDAVEVVFHDTGAGSALPRFKPSK
jgi:uncharacterized OB-fold protein